MTVTNQRLAEILTTAIEKPEIANALIQRVINTLNQQEQHEWQGLTDEERNACLVEADPCEALLEHEAWQLMVDIEAKLKEKNT